MRRGFILIAGAALAACLRMLPAMPAAEALPGHLADHEFWKIVTEFSEPRHQLWREVSVEEQLHREMRSRPNWEAYA